MKKILFASTALVATAGMAAAELTFGGYGRFGLVYDEQAAGSTADETYIEQRFRLTVTGIAETDSGLKFEGRIRFQSDDTADNDAQGDGPGAAGFAVTSGGFRLDIGHVSDALDSGDTVNYYGYGVGLTSFIEQSSAFYDNAFVAGGFGDSDASSQQKVKLRYTAGDFTINASYAPDTPSGDEVWQIGAGYNFGNVSAGFVYGSNQTDDNDFWVIGADGTAGDFSWAAIVGEADDAGTTWGLSGSYAVSASTSISAAVSDGGAASDTAYGLGFAYSLGGGVTLKGGIGSETNGQTKGDLGVIFNF